MTIEPAGKQRRRLNGTSDLSVLHTGLVFYTGLAIYTGLVLNYYTGLVLLCRFVQQIRDIG